MPDCTECHGPLTDRRDIHKTVSDMDRNRRMLTADIVQESGWCGRCQSRARAPMPFLEGTSLGPVALGIVLEFYSRRSTDADIAHFFRSIFWFDISASAVAAARKAVSRALDGQLALIKDAILAWTYAHMDETGFKIGTCGRTGWVWLASVPNAAWVVFATGRTDAVLREHFGWLLDRAIVADGLGAYKRWCRDLQRCWRHLLAKIEEAAVRGGPDDVARYEAVLAFYRRVRDMKTLAPLTMMQLTREFKRSETAHAIEKILAGHPCHFSSFPLSFTPPPSLPLSLHPLSLTFLLPFLSSLLLLPFSQVLERETELPVMREKRGRHIEQEED